MSIKSSWKIIVPLFSLVGALAFASSRPPMPPHEPVSPEARQKMKEEQTRRFIQCFREEFNPTDEQLKFLESKVFGEEKTDFEKIHEEIESVRVALDRGFQSDASEEQVRGLYKRMNELKGKMDEGHFDKMLKLRSVLSVEQRKQFGVCRKRLGPPEPMQR